jgi:calmodulin
LTDIQVRTFSEAFNLFDKAKTGLLPITDFPALFRSIGQNPSESDLKAIAVSLSSSGSEVFDLDHFIDICESSALKELAKPEEILEVFRRFDKDATQTITIPQLRLLLQSYGEGMPQPLADLYVDYISKNCDKEKLGLVNYETLVKALFAKDPGGLWSTSE